MINPLFFQNQAEDYTMLDLVVGVLAQKLKLFLKKQKKTVKTETGR